MKRIELSSVLSNTLVRWASLAACTMVGVVLVASLTTCGQQTALLLTISSTKKVDSFDLLVKNLATNKIVLKRTDEVVDPENANRDISKPGQELRIAVEFTSPGNYLLYVLGKGSAAGSSTKYYQFFIKDMEIEDTREESIVLVPVGIDADKDSFPACGSKGINCAAMSCKFLDCDDNNKGINPFAKEVCGNGKDDDCSAGCNAVKGAGDETCQDADGDGVAAGEDCDDADPCKSPKIREAKNMCDPSKKGTKLPVSMFKLPGACKKTSTPPYCGDGVDQDCNGQDAPCVKDEDCDDYAADVDCNDKDPKINPGVEENCDNKIDDNCNNIINEGCIPCDVDGDNFAAIGSKAADCKVPKTDPDDYDAGVHPNTTTNTNGKEGGYALTALRQYCSYKLGKNGKKHREVDHDGDKLAANADGCPSSNCDVDGDGFQNASCNPPISKRDCNDNDAQTYPGAPDRCGDNKAQNCHSDAKCADITDKDGDFFAPPADCNDSDAKIHPWATEDCDGVDNDCDGLVDEGNPGATGKPIDTNRRMCTDDNDGQCFPTCKAGDKDCVEGVTYKKPGATAGQKFRLSGVCACSKHKPNAKQHAGNRVMCEGESSATGSFLRCFDAIPSTTKERCDKLDHDCNGIADAKTANSKDAMNLQFWGKACSVTEGTCVAGTVRGCDLSKTVANSNLVVSVLGNSHKQTFNPHWICQGAQLPVPEYCNGKDDDCNKAIPAMEQDKDKDGYIECSVSSGDTCKKGKGRFDLDSKYKGCGDCNDKPNVGASINPKASENCNGVDDNCSKYNLTRSHKTGLEDDGVNHCPPKGMVCCTGKSSPSCQNLSTSFANCGACGKTCNWKTADQCSGKSCKCSGAPFCGAGRNCKDKVCKCIAGKDSLCQGCCDGVACRPYGSQSPSKCGSKTACKSCDDGNDCTEDKCVGSGVCQNLPRPYLYACKTGGVSGKCIGKKCCTGCVSGGTCEGGKHIDKCGAGGVTCKICYTTNQCQERSCTKGYCEYPNSPTTKTCTDSLFCTVKEHCSNAKCVSSPKVCPGGQCTAGKCDNSKGCQTVPANEGGTCNDGDKCTVSDKCTGGKCGGSAKNCSSQDDACNKGACNTGTGACYKQPHTGTPYIANCDNQWCTTNDTCAAGVCKPGATRSCSSHTTNCRIGFCSFSKGACDSYNRPDGTGCTASGGKKGACTSGVCVALPPDMGVPDQTPPTPDSGVSPGTDT